MKDTEKPLACFEFIFQIFLNELILVPKFPHNFAIPQYFDFLAERLLLVQTSWHYILSFKNTVI
jgi:hypothetical protein